MRLASGTVRGDDWVALAVTRESVGAERLTAPLDQLPDEGDRVAAGVE